MTSFDDVVDAAKQNANSGSDLASAAGQIIAVGCLGLYGFRKDSYPNVQSE